MSLGKLLTSGKCLVGLQGEENRYQMRRKNLLPKFGSGKNPFATARPQPLQAVSGEKIQTVARTMTPSEVAAATLKETKRLPAVTAIRQTSEVASEPTMKSKVMSRIGGWLNKANPLSWRANRKPDEAKPAVPQFDKPPVQAELSLDRIKVVRNDLSDADVEVVPVKISVKAKAEPVVQPAVKAEETAELIKT